MTTTPVSIDVTPRKPNGRTLWAPTRRLIDGDRVRLPAPVEGPLTGVIHVEPTGPGWAWQVREDTPGGATRYVLVPDTGGQPVSYSQLVDVDPETLDPEAEPEPAWWLEVQDLDTNLDEQIVGAEVVDDTLVVRRRNGEEVPAGRVRGPKGEPGAGSIAQLVAEKLAGVKVAVVFRHDDVQASALAYLPVYARRGVHASWYVATRTMGQVGTGGAMTATADEVKTIHAAGHEVGSHTQSHFYFDDASTEERRRAELAGSKADLEALLGPGYVCETFAYPGNMSGNDGPYEVLDHYLMGTSGVQVVTTAGENNTSGSIDLGVFRAEYPGPLLAPTPEETRARARAWFAAQKDRDGVTIFTLQAHNLNEMSIAQLEALLDVIDEDPQVTTLTAREVAHYVRASLVSLDGRHYVPPGKSRGEEVLRFNAARVAGGGVQVDRRGPLGRAFRALVGGVEAAYLDDALVIKGLSATQSSFENGHQVNFYSAGNTARVRSEVTGSGVWNLSGTAMTYLRAVGMGVRAQRDGAALQAYTTAGVERFTVDTARGTVWLPNLDAPPTGSGRIGELCVVAGVLHIVTATGPTVWTPLATS